MRPPASLIDALTSLRKVIFVSVIITSHFKQLKQRTKATPNTISLALYLRCLTYFFQVPHYILHVCVWSATLCFSCWHVPLCCRSVQWLGTHPDAGCSFLWALPHVLHQTQDIQWTQYVFCLFSALSLLFAFIIGRGCLHAANEHLLLHSHTYRLCVDHCCMQLFLTIGRFGASLCVG